MDIDKNWKEVVKELESTEKGGVDKLIAWLDSTDFKTCPASTKYHLSIKGGLAQHSLNVLRFARSVAKEVGIKVDDKSIIIASLLHDLCKVNFYVEGEVWDKEYKDKFNEWRKMKVWVVDDKEPIGHGEKSLAIVARFLDLTTDEMVAIRWHMLSWDISEAQKYTLRDAMDKFPLLKVIAQADSMAELYETTHES
jgi:23S rRNA maturation-related 3'-5' exoribonuclease YhaM